MPKMTIQTGMILEEMIKNPTEAMYGLELMNVINLKSGTVYQILARLEQAGWLTSKWEDPAVHELEKRPRRRMYHLTPDGIEHARRLVSQDAFPAHSRRARNIL